MYHSKNRHHRGACKAAMAGFAFAAMLSVLSACASPGESRPPQHADGFGNAVRQNIAAQVINPEAAGPDESDRIDGQSAERALEAQRTRSIGADPASLVNGTGGGN